MPEKLIDHVPAPLLENLVEGQWLPLVGAGFSRNAVVTSGDAPPDWNGLGKALAKQLSDFDAGFGALESVSAFEQEFGRNTLVEKLTKLIRAYDAKPGKAHRAFAELGFETIITTNFDFLLEQAYEIAGRPSVPLIGETQLAGINGSPGPKLFKLHGDVHHPDQLVLTETDYDLFLTRHPLLATAVTALFITHTPVLVGYSLDDPDTRQLMSLVKNRLGRLSRQIWSIQVGVSRQDVARFERRGVKVVNLPRQRGISYDEQLYRLFQELGEYWRRELLEGSQSTEERVKADLLIPAESSVTCFFDVPLEMVAWYREAVFPLVEEAGLAAVVASDVQTPSGTDFTKEDALVKRATLVVVDIGDETGVQNAALAAVRRDQKEVLLVRRLNDTIPALFEGLKVLTRDSRNPDRFKDDFRDWISGFRPVALQLRKSEAERLLESGDVGAALISAVALLESELQLRIGQMGPEKVPRAHQMSLLNRAVEDQLISHRDYQLLATAVKSRNDAVHRQFKVPKGDAKRYVEAILKIVARLQDESH